MSESGVIDKTAMVFGQMNEPPGARMRVGLTGLTIAENSVMKVERMSFYSLITFSDSHRQVPRYPHYWDEYQVR